MALLEARSRIALGLLLALTAGSSAAWAEPSREILELAGEAEALLDALQPKEAARIMDRGIASATWKRADRPSKARLLVILGRARAELSDEAGMMRAFRAAVGLDPTVRLSKVNTSPKIIAALERARLEAPVATKPAPPKAPKSKGPEPEPVKAPPIEPSGPSALAWWIEGPIVSGARVRLVVDTAALPRDASIEARRRYEDAAAPAALELTRTGTTTSAVLDLDARPFEVWMLARHRGRIIAQAGTKESPIVLKPKAAPSLSEAWSQVEAPGAESKSSTVTAAARTAPPETAVAGEGVDEDSTTLLFTLGMVGLMAAAVIVSVGILVGQPDCDAPMGAGCSEVRVLPLARF